jgi:hypothetical protein
VPHIDRNFLAFCNTSSSYLILFFPPVSSSAFIGSGGSCLKNNNTNILEIKIKKTISESLLKPTRGNVLRYQMGNQKP